MKRLILFIVLCLIAFTGFNALDRLPPDTAPLVREKYSEWSGVIRVWVAEGMTTGAGNPYAWLSACAAKAESRSAGKYIDVSSVPISAIENYLSTGVNPPDMLIYPSYIHPDQGGLAELAAEYPLRLGLSGSYAVPLLIDMRVWIFRGELPNDMYSIRAACRQSDLGALTALSTGLRAGEMNDVTLPGIDIGLSGESEKAERIQGDTPCRASAALSITDEPLTVFLEHEVDAFVGNLRDIALLTDESGWDARLTGSIALIEDMTVCSIVDKEGEYGRKAACEDFLTYLLNDGQALCARTGAMPASLGSSAYAGERRLAGIEAALDEMECTMEYDAARVQLFIDGTITADEALQAE